MDAVKKEVKGVLTGVVEYEGASGIAIQIGNHAMMVMSVEYAETLVMQLDMLISTLEDDGSEPLDAEPEEVLH